MAILRILALLCLVAGVARPAAAQDPDSALSAGDRASIRETIQAQVDAFRRDDGETAFGLASPGIQGLFGSPTVFMEMVRQGYQPVYRPRAFTFGRIVILNGVPTQTANVISPDGRTVRALYPMTRLPDGHWRIDGCYLEAPDEHQA
jgi:hypothetical protein